ncbi:MULTISPECIES: SemiSWEET transporter [Cetobacterium]|uniref:Lipid A Biosynthesis domain protein n=2 Tax=Cetobacterium TaxID=180162 RepID=U7V5K0_9FUSO|nr:SemiSWEET transporter [Cetobacterium somerae]ERT66982.1 lipid A Biosynthesis domain protein [Cetobacterium somerae ATCC BAA-474]WVJ00757.1 SemiSWEET transporter [Cetobacterium somerae]
MRIIGIIAATLTTIAFFPQVIQVIKSKDTKSISLTMYILFVTGVLLWVLYGFYLNDLPIIIANSIVAVASTIILCYKIREIRSNLKKS